MSCNNFAVSAMKIKSSWQGT